MTHATKQDLSEFIWVVGLSSDDDMLGRLGDARELADRCSAKVGLLRFETGSEVDDRQAQIYIQHGADQVCLLSAPREDQSAWIGAAQAFWRLRPPRLVLSSADRKGRAWSARLAARAGWPLVSPALMVQMKGHRLVAIRLDGAGRRAQSVELPERQTAIVALGPDVAQPLPPDVTRHGAVERRRIAIDSPGRVLASEHAPADHSQADIRHVPKLIAGGRGVGGKHGFDLLRRFADKLEAGVAASRMAVDLGWIESERQVGQTGKTVRPELYLACGISGASHHLEGMSDSRHIVAINTDPNAPLMQRAELAIQADLRQVLTRLLELLND